MRILNFDPTDDGSLRAYYEVRDRQLEAEKIEGELTQKLDDLRTAKGSEHEKLISEIKSLQKKVPPEGTPLESEELSPEDQSPTAEEFRERDKKAMEEQARVEAEAAEEG